MDFKHIAIENIPFIGLFAQKIADERRTLHKRPALANFVEKGLLIVVSALVSSWISIHDFTVRQDEKNTSLSKSMDDLRIQLATIQPILSRVKINEWIIENHAIRLSEIERKAHK